MTSCCCELSQLPSCRNAGANRDRTSLPRGVRTALSPKQGGKVGEKAQPCPLNRRTFLTPLLHMCYTLDKLLKYTPALQHVCCRPPCEGVGRNRCIPAYRHQSRCRPPCEGVGRNCKEDDEFLQFVKVALHVRAWVEISSSRSAYCSSKVALHVRAWVEISFRLLDIRCQKVALHVRAWVEMIANGKMTEKANSRPPCEGVGRNAWKKILKDLGFRSPSM